MKTFAVLEKKPEKSKESLMNTGFVKIWVE
jgi:hypothetical protein